MKLMEMKLRLLEQQLGPITQLTSTQALEQACVLEQWAKDVGPFDPAFEHLVTKREQWFKAATILEIKETRG